MSKNKITVARTPLPDGDIVDAWSRMHLIQGSRFSEWEWELVGNYKKPKYLPNRSCGLLFCPLPVFKNTLTLKNFIKRYL